MSIDKYWFEEAANIDPRVFQEVVRRRGKSRAAAIYQQAMRELHMEWEREQVEAMKARLRTRARVWFRIKRLFTFWRTL